MNTVDVSVDGVEPPSWLDGFTQFCNSALGKLDKENWEVSIILSDDSFIHALNERYRGKDEPTDVLSFPQQEDGSPGPENGTVYAGDIVISLNTLRENATHFHVDEEEELKRLVVHGLLHLAGYDHSDNTPEQPMLTLQESLLSRLTEERIF